MATLTELRARAKQMKYKGYSKLNKADLEKLLSTPPPKPKRLKSKAEQAKNPVKQVAKPKAKAKAKPAKMLSKKALMEAINDDEFDGMSFDEYDDFQRDYLNNYPEMASTERQMEKLNNYVNRQMAKQIFDYYKKNKGSLKGFKVAYSYGKAF